MTCCAVYWTLTLTLTQTARGQSAPGRGEESAILSMQSCTGWGEWKQIKQFGETHTLKHTSLTDRCDDRGSACNGVSPESREQCSAVQKSSKL